jgi:hypothetical protein
MQPSFELVQKLVMPLIKNIDSNIKCQQSRWGFFKSNKYLNTHTNTSKSQTFFVKGSLTLMDDGSPLVIRHV